MRSTFSLSPDGFAMPKIENSSDRHIDLVINERRLKRAELAQNLGLPSEIKVAYASTLIIDDKGAVGLNDHSLSYLSDRDRKAVLGELSLLKELFWRIVPRNYKAPFLLPASVYPTQGMATDVLLHTLKPKTDVLTPGGREELVLNYCRSMLALCLLYPPATPRLLLLPVSSSNPQIEAYLARIAFNLFEEKYPEYKLDLRLVFPLDPTNAMNLVKREIAGVVEGANTNADITRALVALGVEEASVTSLLSAGSAWDLWGPKVDAESPISRKHAEFLAIRENLALSPSVGHISLARYRAYLTVTKKFRQLERLASFEHLWKTKNALSEKVLGLIKDYCSGWTLGRHHVERARYYICLDDWESLTSSQIFERVADFRNALMNDYYDYTYSSVDFIDGTIFALLLLLNERLAVYVPSVGYEDGTVDQAPDLTGGAAGAGAGRSARSSVRGELSRSGGLSLYPSAEAAYSPSFFAGLAAHSPTAPSAFVAGASAVVASAAAASAGAGTGLPGIAENPFSPDGAARGPQLARTDLLGPPDGVRQLGFGAGGR